MTVELERFRAFHKNTLQGFADFRLPDIGIIIRDCTVHVKDGAKWIGFPARPYDDQNGERKWSPMVEFDEDKGKRADFQKAALAALERGEGCPF